MTAQPLACQVDVDHAATKDRAAAADLVLAVACERAIALLRDGRPGQAEYVLTRAGMSAERINPPSPSEVPA